MKVANSMITLIICWFLIKKGATVFPWPQIDDGLGLVAGGFRGCWLRGIRNGSRVEKLCFCGDLIRKN